MSYVRSEVLIIEYIPLNGNNIVCLCLFSGPQTVHQFIKGNGKTLEQLSLSTKSLLLLILVMCDLKLVHTILLNVYCLQLPK